MSRLALIAPIFLWCVCAPAPSSAQDAAGDSPAHISVVDGAALLERDGRSESAPASMPLLAGDRVRTQNGRVEILFAEGSTLHLDTNSTVDFQSDEVIRLLDGRVRLNIVGAGDANRLVSYRVDAPSAWVQIARSGEYRISVYGGDAREVEVELAVLRGAADLVNEGGRTPLGAGERAFARAGLAPSASYVFNSASWDAFDRWSEERRDSRLGVSAEYLPETVQSYASTFNQYGYWQSEPTYGYVWYPRVHPGWRPYYYGRWTTMRPWGWTWIGSDPWAWPTHHYGRWGFSSGAWFWIPGRTWGPAWVSWAYAPGYVSWCPLGWNNRPVFGLSVGVGVYGGYRYDPWNAWTVVPHRGFGHGYVNANVIHSSRIDSRIRRSFVVRESAPDYRGYAVPRSTAPIHSVGARGVAPGGNSGAFRASRGAASAAPTGADPGAAFRSRRSSSAPLTGSGYPAPSREPRAMSTLPAPTRQAPARTRDPYAAAAAAGRTDSAPGARSSTEQRAVPRNTAPSAPGGLPASPTRRAPDYRATPEVYSPGTSSRPEVYRAVPRGERPGQNSNVSAPPSSSVGPADRIYRAPSQSAPDRSPRATPRTGPDGGGPPAGYGARDSYRAPESYRSRPGPERSAPAPSGPPAPSAAPSRSSSPPSSAGPPSGSSGTSSGGGSRSRGGGGQSTGRAVPRGGRG